MFFVFGLAAVLFGLRQASVALARGAGEAMRQWLLRGTRHPLLGVFWGAVATALVQSSSLTTIAVVGLADAGLIRLEGAVVLVMGANIGTTVTAQLVAFHPPDTLIAGLGLVGAACRFLGWRLRYRLGGQVLLGFALVYWGLDAMGQGMAPLAQSPWFRAWLLAGAQRPWLGVAAGVVVTTLVLSSGLTIGLLQQLVGTGALSLASALPVLFGDNIGTTTDTLAASLAVSWQGRRVALFHLLFNVLGTLLFLAAAPVLLWVIRQLSDDPVRQLAHAHTLFNLANTLLQLPLRRVLMRLLLRITPA